MNRGLPSEETARGYPERAEFVLELPSDLRLIEAAVTYLVNRCRSYDFGGSRLSLNFRVGITEALANAVLYGNGGDPAKYVRVEVSLDESRVALCVHDEGHGFDPALVPDPTLPVYADLEQVKRALMNLIKNAIQASPEQGRVEIKAQRVGDKVRVSIKDFGAGIAPDHLRQIFDPFFTTKGSGSGLGLSIVRAIVEENDGEIWVESVPGEKTIFFVVLPAVESASGRFRAERAATMAAG